MQTNIAPTLDDYIEYHQNQIGKNRFMQKPALVHAHTLHLNFYLKKKKTNERNNNVEA